MTTPAPALTRARARDGASGQVRKKHAALSAELEAVTAARVAAGEKAAALRAERPDTDERSAAAAALAAAQARHAALAAEVAKHAANDPEARQQPQARAPLIWRSFLHPCPLALHRCSRSSRA
jgi:hypothetical protein